MSTHAPTCRSCEPRLYLAHETLHGVEELFEVAVAMEIDLEGLESGRLSVAQQIGSNLGGRAVAGWPLLAGRRCVPGNGAELHPEAHPRRDRLAPECLACLAQCRAALDQLRQRQRGRLPDRREPRRAAQGRGAWPAHP